MSDIEADLEAALSEIMRMRMAAESIIRFNEGDKRWAGRVNVAREILDAGAARVPVLGEADARETLQEVRARQEIRQQQQLDEDRRRGRV